MSASRPESGSQNQSSGVLSSTWRAFMSSDWAKPVVLTGLTIPAVVSATYPLDVIQTLKQAGNNAAYRPRFIFPYFANHWRILLRGYFANYTQAGAKNMVLAHRDTVHVRMKDGVASEEDAVNMHGEIELPMRKKITVTLGATGVLAFADILSTNYWANLRLASQLNISPNFNGIWDRVRFAKATAGARYAGLYVGALGVIAGGTILRDPIDQYLPVSQYGMLSPVLAGVLPGLLTGPLGNVWNVIRVNQMKHLNPSTYQMPSMWSVAKDLYTQNGAKVFMRGGAVCMAYTIAAYGAVSVVDHVVNNHIFGDSKRSVSQQGLFAQQVRVENAAAPIERSENESRSSLKK